MQQVKSAIIGKAWANTMSTELMPSSFKLSQDMAFTANESFILGNLTFKTDRNLITPVTVKEGAALYLYANRKRDGKKDADFSVSVLLDITDANRVIAETKAGVIAWKQANS